MQNKKTCRSILRGLGLLPVVAFAAATASGTVPRLSESVSVEQSDRNGLVTVTYRLLDAEGIVTVDFQTNGVSIGAMNFNNVYGDVNMLVNPSETEDRHVYWRPSKSWPEGGRVESGFTAKVTVWPKATPPDYMVVDLLGTSSVRYYVSADALPGEGSSRNSLGVRNPIYKTHKLAMRRVPAEGVTFMMGSPTSGPESAGRSANQETPHKVTLTNDFYLAVFETTQGQWHYLGAGETFPQETAGATLPIGDAYPVTGFAYSTVRGDAWPSDRATHDLGGSASPLIAQMRARFHVGFDLPTDAQWEYACRAGESASLYNGSNIPGEWWWWDTPGSGEIAYPALDEIAWHNMNANGTIHEVGLKKPNAWGFYDMLGNAWELVLDWSERMSWGDPGVVSGDDVTEPFGLTESMGDGRVVRGGSAVDTLINVRTSTRWRHPEYVQGDKGGNGNATMGAFRLMCPVGLTW